MEFNIQGFGQRRLGRTENGMGEAKERRGGEREAVRGVSFGLGKTSSRNKCGL